MKQLFLLFLLALTACNEAKELTCAPEKYGRIIQPDMSKPPVCKEGEVARGIDRVFCLPLEYNPRFDEKIYQKRAFYPPSARLQRPNSECGTHFKFITDTLMPLSEEQRRFSKLKRHEGDNDHITGVLLYFFNEQNKISNKSSVDSYFNDENIKMISKPVKNGLFIEEHYTSGRTGFTGVAFIENERFKARIDSPSPFLPPPTYPYVKVEIFYKQLNLYVSFHTFQKFYQKTPEIIDHIEALIKSWIVNKKDWNL